MHVESPDAHQRQSSERERCSVPGCSGVLHHEPDRIGHLHTWCIDCEYRVRKLKLVLGRVPESPERAPAQVREILDALTDAEVRDLFLGRFGLARQVMTELKLGSDMLPWAWKHVDPLHIGHEVLVPRRPLREAMERQRAQYTTRGSYVERLPRSASEAIPIAELARRTNVTTTRAASWALENIRKHPAQLKRRKEVVGNRSIYVYWWNEIDEPN